MRLKHLALLLLILELISVTHGRNTYFSVYIGPLVFVFSGLALSYLVILESSKIKSEKSLVSVLPQDYLLQLPLLLLILVLGSMVYSKLIGTVPIAVEQSDIIPQVRVMVDRFVGRRNVYDVIHDFGYAMPPNYLPFTWMPFGLARYAKIDDRWIPFFAFAIGYILFCFALIKHRASHFTSLVILPAVILIAFISYTSTTFTHAIELLPASYYLILALGLLLFDKTWHWGVAIAICMLSRYSFVFWLPILGLVLLIRKGNSLWKIAGTTIGLVALFYLFPFYIKDPGMLTRSLAYYDTATLAEWSGQAWQAKGEKPYQLFQGTGLACFFYDFTGGALSDKISLLKKTQILLSIVMMLALAIYWWRNKEKVHQDNIFLLGALHALLIVFYALVQIPYAYLYIVPCMVSIVCYISLRSEKE
jgi:hypothetical protein